MEIYHLSKYENIADRLKRLANNASNATAIPIDVLQLHNQKTNQQVSSVKKENVRTQLQSRANNIQSLKNQKVATLETEYRPNGEKEYRKQLTSPRNNRRNPTLEKQAKYVSTKYFEPKIAQSQMTQNKSIPWKNTQVSEGKTMERKKTLSKVKSDKNINIEDILESFNNYKQNKEKLLTTIDTNCVREQTPIKECQKLEAYLDKKRAFMPIDNIWNEKAEKIQNFQISLKYFRYKLEEGDTKVSETNLSQISYLERRSLLKPKFASKNEICYQDVNVQKLQMRAILSPRGTRIPGKICKNI